MGTDEPICEAEIEAQTQQTSVSTSRGEGRRDELGDWDQHIYI